MFFGNTFCPVAVNWLDFASVQFFASLISRRADAASSYEFWAEAIASASASRCPVSGSPSM
jgi:hypothetical protein